MGFSVRRPNQAGRHLVLLFVLAMVAGACATGSSIPAVDVITVTGDITVRGNEPFTEVVLITDDSNWYLLDLTREQRDDLLTPARATITGPISLGEWNGRPFTRLRVDEIVPVLE